MEDLFDMMTQSRKRRTARPLKYEGESLREALGGTYSESRDEQNWLDLDHALAAKRRSLAEEFETDWGGEEETTLAETRRSPDFDL